MLNAHREDNEEQRDLTLVAMLVATILIAGGIFIVNSLSTNFMTARYAPPVLNNIPIMTPTSVPTTDAAPVQ